MFDTLFVACKNPETCLQLVIPDGFDSPFWKNMGYKYNRTSAFCVRHVVLTLTKRAHS